MEKTRISKIQIFTLMSGFLFGSTVIVAPVAGAKNDAWISMIIGGTCGILLMLVYASISLFNPSKTLVDILREKFGKVPGSIIAALYVWYFIHVASLVLRDYGEFICTVAFPETPMIVVIVIFAIVLLYGVNSGIEVIGRISELLVPVIPVSVFIITFSLFTISDFTAFLPILEGGMMPVLDAAFSYVTFPFGETVAFLMVYPHLNRMEEIRRTVLTAAVILSTLGIIIFFRDISVLGSELLSRATFIPHVTSLVFPEINVDPLVDINLMIAGGIKISVCLYAASTALSQLAGIQDYSWLSGALTVFCVVLSVWQFENVLELFDWTDKIWPFYSLPFQIIIPLVLFVMSLWDRKKAANHTD